MKSEADRFLWEGGKNGAISVKTLNHALEQGSDSLPIEEVI